MNLTPNRINNKKKKIVRSGEFERLLRFQGIVGVQRSVTMKSHTSVFFVYWDLKMGFYFLLISLCAAENRDPVGTQRHSIIYRLIQ